MKTWTTHRFWAAGLSVLLLFSIGRAWGRNVLALDGTDDRAEANATVHPAGSALQTFTAEAWFYPKGQAGFIMTDDAYDIILHYQSGAANDGWGIRFRLWGSSGASVSKTEFRDVQTNAWNHVAVMFDASTGAMTVAINGKLSASPTLFSKSGFWADAAQKFTVGGMFGSSGGTFAGDIDEVRVSDTLRYASDFTPAAAFSVDGHTRCLIHFDEPQGDTWFADAGPEGHDLTGIDDAHIAAIGGGGSEEETDVAPPEMQAPAIGTDGSVTIRWSSHSHCRYTVYASTHPRNGFTVVMSGIAGTAPVNTFTDTLGGVGVKFWKVLVEP